MPSLAALSIASLAAACASPQNRCGAFGQHYQNPVFPPGRIATGDQAYNAVKPSFIGSARHPNFPMYPAAAQECEASGSATLQFQIQSDGTASNVQVVSWNSSELFARAAITFVTQPDVRFEPERGHPFNSGKPARYHLNFRLAPH